MMTEASPADEFFRNDDACPSHESLRKIAEGDSFEFDLDGFVEHLSQCKICREEFDRLLQIDSSFLTSKPVNVPSSDRYLFGSQGRLELIPFCERFTMVTKIGSGAIGDIYRAFDRKLSRIVAVKQIRPERLRIGTLESLMNEACFQAALNHPHIVTIHDIGLADGIPMVVMEFMSRGSLADFVKFSGLTSVMTAKLLAPVARALHFAHLCSVVHSDIKPSNILLTAGCGWGIDWERELLVAKLSDFGTAKNLGEWVESDEKEKVGGTLPYSAPELLSLMNSRNTPASDIYSFGVTLYETLTGRKPFLAETRELTMKAILKTDPAPLRTHDRDIDPGIEAICMKCLDKNPANRFSDARELAQSLEDFVIESSKPIRLNSFWTKLRTKWFPSGPDDR